jgi:FtsH-binding integral membrane protein
VLLFTGLTAYDTQRIKQVYFAAGAAADLTKPALMGALTLYLDFINLFMMMLQLTGDRRGR